MDSDVVAVVIVFNLVIAYVLERYDEQVEFSLARLESCLLYTSPSPRDA